MATSVEDVDMTVALLDRMSWMWMGGFDMWAFRAVLLRLNPACRHSMRGVLLYCDFQ